MNSHRLDQQIKYIYQQVISDIQPIHNQYPAVYGMKSRDNLLAYIALEKYNLKELSIRLKEHGLASIEDANAHVLYTMKKLLAYLDRRELLDSSLSCPSPSESSSILQSRANRILGNCPGGRRSRIMVTLDAKMIYNPSLMEELLEKGMDIARINCAHGDPKIWEELIFTLRKTEEKLKANAKLKGSPCKIYMDLAGPKIRIGSFTQQEKVLTIKAPVDPYGKAIGPIEGYLDSRAAETRIDDDSFTFAVKESSPVDLLRIGDECTFLDLNNQKRILRVTGRVSETCVKVQLDYTAFIGGTTVFIHEKGTFPIRSLKQGPVEIQLSKGDYLRLYLDGERLGHAASESGHAGVPVTLKKAFQNVHPRDRIFIDDGKIGGIVHRIEKDYIDIKILSPADKYVKVREGKGVNLPDSLLSLNIPALTDKDLSDLPFIVRHSDMVGISFVHSPNDLKMLKSHLELMSASHLPVIVKIETKDAIHHLGRILLEGLNFKGFGVMIARGDLAIEVGYEQLASAQNQIFNLCSAAHIPVIWATGVLDNLTKKGNPTRAEITDADFAAYAEAVMLNKGKYIPESIELLNQILTNESSSFRDSQSGKNPYTQLGVFN